MKTWAKGLAGLAVTGLALWWVLRDVVFADVVSNIATGNMPLLGASLVVTTLGFVLRAMRWKVLLMPVTSDTTFRSRFAAVSIGFMANNVLPARVGEVARAYALSRVAPVSAAAAFGSVVVERFLDGLVLLLFLVIPVLTPGFPQSDALTQGAGLAMFNLAVAFVVVVLPALIVMAVMPQRLVWLATRMTVLLPEALGRKLIRALIGLLDAAEIMRSPRLLAVAFAATLLFWAWQGLAFWLGMLAFGIDTGFISAIFTEAVVGFAVAVPSAPGFFGTFHFGTSFALSTVYGVADPQALAFAFAYHFGGWVPITAIGLWYAWKLGLSVDDVEQSGESASDFRGSGTDSSGKSAAPG